MVGGRVGGLARLLGESERLPDGFSWLVTSANMVFALLVGGLLHTRSSSVTDPATSAAGSGSCRLPLPLVA